MTQWLKTVSPYIVVKSIIFFRVGLNEFLCSQGMWQHVECWIKAYEYRRIDLVDLDRLDCDQMHVLNSEPLIALVKYNGCDLISHWANDGVTRDEL